MLLHTEFLSTGHYPKPLLSSNLFPLSARSNISRPGWLGIIVCTNSSSTGDCFGLLRPGEPQHNDWSQQGSPSRHVMRNAVIMLAVFNAIALSHWFLFHVSAANLSRHFYIRLLILCFGFLNTTFLKILIFVFWELSLLPCLIWGSSFFHPYSLSVSISHLH